MNIGRRLKRKVAGYIEKTPPYERLIRQNETLEALYRQATQKLNDNKPLVNYRWFVEPGHYYSPLIDIANTSFGRLLDLSSPRMNLKEVSLSGVELNRSSQLVLLDKLSRYVAEIPDYNSPSGLRYRYDNDQFGRMDASVLFAMLRHLRPHRIIEVGSGWTSALMLDVNELFPRVGTKLTFVEPYPDRLYSTLKHGDKKQCTIVVKQVQSVPAAEFKQLQKDDVLFIDNSHVGKYSSDVNHLFLDVLPNLHKGVVIHVHDIFYPFEYPIQWVKQENRNWNEAYMLHALLIGSNMFEIMFWPSYLKVLDQQQFERSIPTATGHGGSIWLKKVR